MEYGDSIKEISLLPIPVSVSEPQLKLHVSSSVSITQPSSHTSTDHKLEKDSRQVETDLESWTHVLWMEQQLADTEAKLQDLQTNYTKVEHERDTAAAELQARAKRDTALILSLDQVQHVLESTQALISCPHSSAARQRPSLMHACNQAVLSIDARHCHPTPNHSSLLTETSSLKLIDWSETIWARAIDAIGSSSDLVNLNVGGMVRIGLLITHSAPSKPTSITTMHLSSYYSICYSI
jgi:hypothetical protein